MSTSTSLPPPPSTTTRTLLASLDRGVGACCCSVAFLHACGGTTRMFATYLALLGPSDCRTPAVLSHVTGNANPMPLIPRTRRQPAGCPAERSFDVEGRAQLGKQAEDEVAVLRAQLAKHDAARGAKAALRRTCVGSCFLLLPLPLLRLLLLLPSSLHLGPTTARKDLSCPRRASEGLWSGIGYYIISIETVVLHRDWMRFVRLSSLEEHFFEFKPFSAAARRGLLRAATMSITVAEEGNRRVGAMDHEEVAQCVTDICNWFENAGGFVAAERGNVEALQKSLDLDIPEILYEMWLEADGGVWFGEKQLLGASEARKQYSSLEKDTTRPEYLPFAADVDGTLLLVDTSSPEKAVYEWDTDGLGDKLCSSLLNFFEDMRNNLLSGRFEFIEEVGLVEKDSGGK
eukprot:scaffold367_cov254-Pinguiococcus_pyrenoidosus.AAC.21